MANVLNRITKKFCRSVNTPDYSSIDWIINPDMSAVLEVPQRYWKITGDIVSEMSQAEKDAVDAQILNNSRDSIIAEIDNPEDIIRQILKILISEINILRAEHSLPDRTFDQLKTQIRNGLGS